MTSLFPNDLSQFPISDELKAALRALLNSTGLLAPEQRWLETISALAVSLHGERRVIAPFVEAWRLLYTDTLFLDHVQDGDPLGDPQLEALPPPLQYHLAFSLYLAAQHALSLLDPEAVSATRILRLQRFWSASTAQLASGQFLDLKLALTTREAQSLSPLVVYERLALQKTGATFALAFGGVAMLVTDDEVQSAALADAGSVYGMLLQYHDDLADYEPQEGQPGAMTLTRALLAVHPGLAANAPGAAAIFWRSIYSEYWRALETILAPLPPATRAIFMDLLRNSFGEPHEVTRVSGDAPSPEATR